MWNLAIDLILKLQIQNQLSGKTSESTLPLQQQLLLCSVAIATNKKLGSKSENVTCGKLHTTLLKVWNSAVILVRDCLYRLQSSGVTVTDYRVVGLLSQTAE